jgi:type II secretion system protein N
MALADLVAKLPHPGPRVRAVLKYTGYVFLFLFTFVFAVQLTFPYGAVKNRIEDALSAKYDVTIGDVERGWVPGRMYLKAVTIKTRPSAADIAKAMETPDPKERDAKLALLVNTLYIDTLEVDLAFLPFLRGVTSLRVDATIGNGAVGYGHIHGKIAFSNDGFSIDIDGDDLPSQAMPMRELVGLPMSGKIEFAVALDVPREKLKSGKVGPNWKTADGEIEVTCPTGCTFGDGKTKLHPKLKNQRSQAMAEGGIEFGKVNIDKLAANIEIKDSHLKITKFEAPSRDGELHVDFDLTLAEEFGESMTAGCLRFNGSQELLKREPKTHAAISTTGANLGPDNLFHIRLDGRFKEMKRLPQFCGPGFADKNMDNPGGSGPARPNLTVQPDEPIKPPLDAGALPPPPPPPPATPPPSTTPSDAGTPPNHVGQPPVPPNPGPDGEGSAQPPPGEVPIQQGSAMQPGGQPATEPSRRH